MWKTLHTPLYYPKYFRSVFYEVGFYVAVQGFVNNEKSLIREYKVYLIFASS